MSQPISNPSAPCAPPADNGMGGEEGQENVPLRNDSPGANMNDEIPPAYGHSIQQPSAVPTAPIHGKRSAAAPAAPVAVIGSEGQPLNPQSASVYPPGVVIVPITNNSAAAAAQTRTYGNATVVASSQYPGAAYIASTQHQPIYGQQAPQQQVRVVAAPPPQPHPPHPHAAQADDPTCIYILAVAAFFIPLIGLIAMCFLNCGNGLPPRQAGAFRILVVATAVSILLGIIFTAA